MCLRFFITLISYIGLTSTAWALPPHLETIPREINPEKFLPSGHIQGGGRHDDGSYYTVDFDPVSGQILETPLPSSQLDFDHGVINSSTNSSNDSLFITTPNKGNTKSPSILPPGTTFNTLYYQKNGEVPKSLGNMDDFGVNEELLSLYDNGVGILIVVGVNPDTTKLFRFEDGVLVETTQLYDSLDVSIRPLANKRLLIHFWDTYIGKPAYILEANGALTTVRSRSI